MLKSGSKRRSEGNKRVNECKNVGRNLFVTGGGSYKTKCNNSLNVSYTPFLALSMRVWESTFTNFRPT